MTFDLVEPLRIRPLEVLDGSTHAERALASLHTQRKRLMNFDLSVTHRIQHIVCSHDTITDILYTVQLQYRCADSKILNYSNNVGRLVIEMRARERERENFYKHQTVQNLQIDQNRLFNQGIESKFKDSNREKQCKSQSTRTGTKCFHEIPEKTLYSTLLNLRIEVLCRNTNPLTFQNYAEHTSYLPTTV